MRRLLLLLAAQSLALAPPRVWRDGQWARKQLDPAAAGKTRGGGRSRGARRTAQYAALKSYHDAWVPLLAREWAAEQEALRDQLCSWPRPRLAAAGLLLSRLEARRLADFFGEPVVQLSLPPTRRGPKGDEPPPRPPLPFHCFAVGDVVALCAGDDPLPPASLLATSGAPPPDAAAADAAAVDGVVLRRTAGALRLVVRQLPPQLAPAGRSPGRSTAFPFCVTRGASAVPFERCMAAVAAAAEPELPPQTLDAGLRELIVGASGLGAEQLCARAAEAPPFFSRTRAAAASAAKAAAARQAATLTAGQRSVVKQSLGRRLTLVQGPPGTGKTRTAVAILGAMADLHRALRAAEPAPPPSPSAKQASARAGRGGGGRGGGRGGGGGGGGAAVAPLAAAPGASGAPVLAVAASNVAADELLAGLLAKGVRAVRVGQPVSVRESLRNATLDAALERAAPVLAARERLRLAQRGGSKAGVADAFDAMQRAEAAEARRLLGRAEVCVASCVGAGRLAELCAPTGGGEGGEGGEGPAGGGGVPLRFASVLIDEATQATEPASLVALLHGCAQLVLVGDGEQLPPTVTDLAASRAGLGTSLFSRLQAAGLPPLLLDLQHRMHPALAEFSSGAFYHRKLRSAVEASERPLPAGLRWPQPACPIAFVEVDGAERRASADGGAEGGRAGVAGGAEGGLVSSSTSFVNEEEAAALAGVARALLQGRGLSGADVGCITPYSAQAQLLRRALAGEAEAEAVEVSSVDGFQGREKEVILFSAVRSNAERAVGFLSDSRRLNVAITRARRGLVLVGASQTLAADPTWRDYLRFLRRRGCIVPSVEELLPPRK